MPEGPEVAMTRDYLFYKLKNTTIQNVFILKGRYLYEPIKGYDLIKNVRDVLIKDINTKGKLMWFTINIKGKDAYIINTFGLSGSWGFRKTINSRIKFVIKRKNRLYNLYFNDQINYGTLGITDDPKVLMEKINSLEIDLLKDRYDFNTINNLIKSYMNKKISHQQTKIVEFMMNQTKGSGLGCGLGNYLVPEILYSSKISPHRELSKLSINDVKILTENIKKTLKNAFYNNRTGYMKKFDDFRKVHNKLTNDGKFSKYLPDINIPNDEFDFNVYSKNKDKYGNVVSIDIILKDRKTHWVPSVQK